jgi:hypothetical protein
MKTRILKKITNKWHIKLLSLGLAAMLWVYVDNLKEKERFVSVPVEVRNIPHGYMLSDGVPSSIKVILKGKESRLALLDETPLIGYIDLENSEKLSRREFIRIDKNSIPQGITVKEITPRIIEVSIEKVEERSVMVIPVITGEPPFGYFFEDVFIDPEKVSVSGPESLIKTLETVYTKDISIKNLTETTVKEVGLDLPDEKIFLDEETVISVKVIIKEQFVLKRIEKKEVLLRNLADHYDAHIEEKEISVLLKVPKRLEREISAESIRIFVDCAEIDETGKFTLPLGADSTVRDVTFLKTEPNTAAIEVGVKKEPSR